MQPAAGGRNRIIFRIVITAILLTLVNVILSLSWTNPPPSVNVLVLAVGLAVTAIVVAILYERFGRRR